MNRRQPISARQAVAQAGAQAAAVGAALLALSACRLIDQRTFAPAPGPPAAAVAGPSTETRTDTRTPLITIAPGTNLASYRSLLRATAGAAEARDPRVRFDVVAVVPATGSLGSQVAAADAARSEAAQVAHALADAGVAPTRIDLQTRSDPRASRADVRVYVR